MVTITDDARQDQRTARAMRETFTFIPCSEGWVCETEAGKCYIVNETSCGCPDHLHRCAALGIRCKHRTALGHHLIAIGADQVATGLRLAKQPERHTPCFSQEEEAAIARIFGDA